MQRMCAASIKSGLVLYFACAAVLASHARGDLIRSSPARSFPDIAGDIVGIIRLMLVPQERQGSRLHQSPLKREGRRLIPGLSQSGKGRMRLNFVGRHRGWNRYRR